MISKLISLLAIIMALKGCDNYDSPNPNDYADQETTSGLYLEQYDPVSDKGQYWLPEMSVKPKKYWGCVEIIPIGNINELGETEKIRGLQYHLLCQSLAGLANRAVEQGKSEIGVWLHDHSGKESYKLAKAGLERLGIYEQGLQSGLELARNDYGPTDGVELQLKGLFDGYVLTDVENNPESNIVASVASHVYNSIIVDVRDKDYYEEAGYTMTYDATRKTTLDAWNEFKDKCNNKALVVMPVQTGELREFAIRNNLFVINLNKEHGNPSAGQNSQLFEEVLEWLAPNAPVYGWEQGVNEDVFVGKISEYGKIMVPYDWAYNTSLTSILYKERQPGLAKVQNPQFMDFEDGSDKYVSFYLSDGDNVQWMLNDFGGSEYYSHPLANGTKMSFGLPIDNLSMIAPDINQAFFDRQGKNNTLVQTFGGGYNYADTFGMNSSRASELQNLAEATAAHMRQHRVKVLGLIAKDVRSAAAREAYQAYIDANDQLEGVIAVQYTPYAGGQGEIMWMTNARGYDIPIITVKYSIWNFGDHNNENEGTPTYIANKVNSDSGENPFNLVAVHAWSSFADIGESQDEVGENNGNYVKGPGAAQLCIGKLKGNTKVVNVEELIWRVRMHYRSEQTKEFLNTYF
ncbi:GxGYxYP domain-containing protein [Sinomicrobium weinanense]|nr:GxGYxYP domain-containing protein [Sinomicrobium weinanense]MBU3125581.1 hypothetical protein [Sinomicrobium weinanense]